jgi:glycerol-3-phosphate acyltransferase PlsY
MIGYIAYFCLAFLIGGIPFGYLVAHVLGKDITREGSGNIGATNVARVLGPVPGALVFFLDAGKGMLATYLASFFASPTASNSDLKIYLELSGSLAAVFGHSFSPFLKLRGGKGVATAFGGLLLIFPQPLLFGLLTFILTLLLTQVVSIASLMGTAVAAFLVATSPDLDLVIKLLVSLAALLIYYRHRSNIDRIFTGTENIFQFGSRK